MHLFTGFSAVKYKGCVLRLSLCGVPGCVLALYKHSVPSSSYIPEGLLLLCRAPPDQLKRCGDWASVTVKWLSWDLIPRLLKMPQATFFAAPPWCLSLVWAQGCPRMPVVPSVQRPPSFPLGYIFMEKWIDVLVPQSSVTFLP